MKLIMVLVTLGAFIASTNAERPEYEKHTHFSEDRPHTRFHEHHPYPGHEGEYVAPTQPAPKKRTYRKPTSKKKITSKEKKIKTNWSGEPVGTVETKTTKEEIIK